MAVRRLMALVVLLAPTGAAAQNLGYKVLGSLGIDAGTQPAAGIYVVDQFLVYDASELRDRDGDRVPVRGLDIDALGNGLGMSLTLEYLGLPYISAAFAVPLARVRLNTADPRAALDRFGLGDIYLQPIRLGWRLPHVDLVMGYGVYAPTGAFEPRRTGGVGRGQWTHQLTVGGGVFADAARRYRFSMVASYELNGKKRGIDITRGSTLQLQGGAGARLFSILDVGVAGYALWQVTDDQGSELPAQLRGARDRTFGLGPELGVVLPMIDTRLGARHLWDFGVRSRPVGRVFVATLSYLLWSPDE